MLNTDILNAPDDALTLNDKAQILLQTNEEAQPQTIARLTKGATITTPNVTLTNMQDLTAEQVKPITKHLQAWLDKHIQTALQPLLCLEDLTITGAAKGIAFQLFEKFGFLYRKDILSLAKELSKEDRQFLGKRGVRLGAYYVYQRDMLKPAAVIIRSALWRAFHGDHNSAIMPPAGNVSMTVDPKAPKDFYRTIGFPIFGTTAVRMDMVERVNSAVFDGAKEGRYVFDPALASTIGVGVDALYKVLDDLGFKYETHFEDIPAKENETSEANEGESKAEPEKKEIRTYHLKKVPIKPLRRAKNKTHKGKSPKPANKASKGIDPNSPFAALQGLIKK